MKASQLEQKKLEGIKGFCRILVRYEQDLMYKKQDDRRFWDNLFNNDPDYALINKAINMLDNAWIPEDKLVKYFRDGEDFDTSVFEALKDKILDVLDSCNEDFLQTFFSTAEFSYRDFGFSITGVLRSAFNAL